MVFIIKIGRSYPDPKGVDPPVNPVLAACIITIRFSLTQTCNTFHISINLPGFAIARA